VTRALRAAVILLCVVAAEGQGHADSATEVPVGLLRFRAFGAADELHDAAITSITQDASGFLWLATSDGVARYDGERFTHYGVDQGLVSTSVEVVGVAPSGNVCAGGRVGLACWDGVQFSRAEAAGLPFVAVHAIVSARGQLWVGTATGLYVTDEHRQLVPAAGWPGRGPVRALWGDERGMIAGDEGRVWTSAGDGSWRELAEAGLAGDRIEGVVRDAGGALWIRTAQHVWRMARGAWRAEDLSDGFPAAHHGQLSGSMILGPFGEVWFGCDRGIAVRDGDHWRVIDRSAGVPFDGARTMFVDREGSTWVGSTSLFQLRGRGLIERYDERNGFPGDTAWSFARDVDGALWAGTSRCLARMRQGRWDCLLGSEKHVVRSFVFAPQGGVFLGGMPAELLYIDPAGKVVAMGRELVDGNDRAILALKLGLEGDLWVATRTGLFRLPGAVPGRLEPVVIPGVPPDACFSSLIVAEGRLWAASTSGIAVLEAGRWRVFGAGDGLRSSSVRYLAHTHDHAYCVAYSDPIGLSCFELAGPALSAIRHIGVPEGLATGAVYFLGEDPRHHLWVGTGDGVDVLTPRGVEHFSMADGLAGDDQAATALLVDGDGSLWLGSTGGASHVRAERYAGPPPPPRAVVRSGQLGRSSIYAQRTGELDTPYDRNALKVELGSDRLGDAGRVEYQVRLLPLETEWSITPARQARYPALLPGAYRLEVRARIGTGAWGATAALPFTVRPAWWQTRWFLALSCLVIAAAIAVAFTWRQRAVLQRRTRQLNEASAASLRALLELVPDLISVHRDGKVIYANLAARRIYGLVPDAEITGLGDRIHPDDRPRVVDVLHPAHGGATRRAPEVVELRVRDAAGGWRICEISGVWMELAGATVLVASGRDVTERHQMRAQLLVSDRMASLGTLAAGIAHEINNPLSYVLGNLQLIAEALADPSEPGHRAQLTAAVDDATDGAQRVRKIVQGLRSFSRAEEESRVQLEISEVLRVAIRLTANEVRHRAQLVCELGATPRVIADDGRLTQVFINLIVNAAHAIPEGRSDANRITVRTRSDERGDAVIEVEDTGQGMAPEVQARAFDPFFTTKEVGAGTGLGLSICHGIITALGGRISIESAVGRGTVLRVVLPAAAAPQVQAAAHDSHPAPAAHRLRVLVVDDEPLVLEMLARVLRRDHEVVTAACGQAALALVRDGAWFDAIVSDVMMPNMTGLELLEALVELAPDQARRFIFLSGGVFTPETRARLDELGALQLEKPVNARELRSAVLVTAATAAAGAATGAAAAVSMAG
jgi:PAS domain S-box-containing protein